MGHSPNITVKQAEIDKLRTDPTEFFRQFIKVPDGKLLGEPFIPNYPQRQILEAFKVKNRAAICVHRRAGKTCLLCALAIWQAFARAGNQILIIAPQGSHIELFFDVLCTMFDLSEELAGCVRAFRRSQSPKVIELTNGSKIVGFTTGARTRGEGISIRGRGADLIILDEAGYLNDVDFNVIKPIYTGDIYRDDIKLLAASTLNYTRNTFYDWVSQEKDGWSRIIIPVNKNPDVPKDTIVEWRKEYTEMQWDVEFLCKLNLVGAGVFRESYVRLASRQNHYYSLVPTRKAIRTMGVDWNKFKAGTNIVMLEMDPETGKYWVVMREEIPRSEYTLTNAVQKIIELNHTFSPHYIYVDIGYGEASSEMLHKFGEEHPETGLHSKVRTIDFGSRLETVDPFTKEITRKPLKQVMVNVTVKLFEDTRIILSAHDRLLMDSLIGFKIKEVTQSHVKYSEDNDHPVAALCLAVWAMHENFDDPLRVAPATNTYFLPFSEVGKERKQAPDLYRSYIPVAELEGQRLTKRSGLSPSGGRPTPRSGFGPGNRSKL